LTDHIELTINEFGLWCSHTGKVKNALMYTYACASLVIEDVYIFLVKITD